MSRAFYNIYYLTFDFSYDNLNLICIKAEKRMNVKDFGYVDDKNVSLFTLKNEFITAEVLNYGGILRNLTVNGKNVVCGFDDIDGYIRDTEYHGSIVGRYGNRIANGKFTLNGNAYILNKNEKGVTHLHGGKVGFNKRMWKAETAIGDDGSQSVVLSLFSPDGEEGYHSNLEVTVTYTLVENKLNINFQAKSDMDTPINLLNHTYFNLCGYDGGDVLSHKLKINADYYAEVDEYLIPVRKAAVERTVFDFRKSKRIGQDICDQNQQLLICGGYDHNYYITQNIEKEFGGKKLYEAAVLSNDGDKMTIYTDMPCVQFYTANYMTADNPFMIGVKQEKNHALCLETQYAPNSPNHGEAILNAGELYDKTTVFVFE